MKLRNLKKIVAILVLASSAALAGTQATGTNTVSPTLKVSATLTSAIRLTLATGTGCSITAGSGTDYAMDFGTVDALGISNGACGSKYPPATPGTSKAVYYSDYTLTPVFTNQGNTANSTITAYVSSNFSQAGLAIVQTNTAPTQASDLSAMSTSSGAPTSLATAGQVSNNTAMTRYIGVSVDPTNSNTPSGASSSAVVTYTLTVQ